MRLITKAITCAATAHKGQNRKNTKIPYIVHPFTVGMLLKENNCSDEIVAAGILHDTVEDTHLTLAYIEKEFGKKIRELVENVSEPDKNLSWEKRKEFTLRKLETTSLEVRLITVADKLHNISSIY